MAKEAYYFSHDSNARHDPKITAMRGVYGSEGYGWYWILVEMMRDADEYKLDMHSKYAFNAYAMQMHSNSHAIASFVDDCINEFNLFSSDGKYFWSNSLLIRMELKNERSEKAKKAADARWNKGPKNANASKKDADAVDNDALKERKGKEIKGKENKEREYTPPVLSFNEIESFKDKIHALVKQCEIKKYTLYELEEIFSFIGVVDIEVIEAAIKKGSDKSIKYAINTLKGFISEGKTKKEHIYEKPVQGTSYQGRSGKQHIPIVSENSTSEKVSDEEMEELIKLARKLDGKK
ncbi:DUF4373 domain-containing protein [Paenibacillus sp. L3-i20]|uniref:DUF4373 domain-containing protein n=1 Tax=Paenibacillus sp. L3-i20 TaxID=2905833 RepID=UPI001EDD35B4|nr:DUF4373 domain-containing protein [Paenibacillus sp. L3-i20]GKU79812.1 hypothetical protein L3i20_v242090 [Paenibacillus sp. L3-i20]